MNPLLRTITIQGGSAVLFQSGKWPLLELCVSVCLYIPFLELAYIKIFDVHTS